MPRLRIGQEKERKIDRRNHTGQKYNVRICYAGDHNNEDEVEMTKRYDT